jgi:glycosyltransferase involved in cell wall biosynthesis
MFPPFHNAGSEVTALAMFQGLIKRGHEVQVISVEYPETYRDVDGIHVHRPPDAEPERTGWFMEKYRWADVVITHLNCTGHAMHLAMEAAKPLVHLVHNHNQLKFHNVRPIRAQLLIYNTDWVREAAPMNPSIVIHPIVYPDHYRVERPDAETVTFVNLTVTKGALVFYELARRLLDTPFVGVKGAYGDQHLIPDNLENLTIHEQMPDLRPIYARTKVVLMPSDYESYGRVAVEAACSGIPSIVHPTPGLREALGPAGIYVDRADVDGWERELRRLLSDEDYYNERSLACLELAQSLRPEEALDRAENALLIVNQHGLKNSSWTFEALGEEAYRRLARDKGHFDPDKEPGFKPSLGGISMQKPAFTTDRQIYLNSTGRPVERSSPDKQMLYLGVNATIPFDQAVQMGIVDEAGTPFWERRAEAEFQAQGFATTERQAFEGPGPDEERPFLNSDAIGPLTAPEAAKVPRERGRRRA